MNAPVPSGTAPRTPFRYGHETVLTGLLVALLAAAGWLDPRFVRWENQVVLSAHIWELALLCLPMTFIIITAGIDLSVGSIFSLAAVVLGLACLKWHWSPGAAAALALLTGVAAGLLNGLFVAYVRVHPLIVTLATLAAYYGAAVGLTEGGSLSGFPQSLRNFGAGQVFGLPIPGLLFTAAAVAAAVILGATPFGRYVYALGHNETAARFSGLPVARLKLALYASSGLAAGLAAILFAGRNNTANTDVGAGLSLDVITAVVLGGASIFGGRGRIVGTVLGVLLIHETREFLSWQWGRDELRPIVVGGLLIGSVLLNAWLTPKARE